MSKKILLLYPNIPFGFNKNGGASVLTSRIYSLAKIFDEVQLVRIVTESDIYVSENYHIKKEYLEINSLEEVKFQEIITAEKVIYLKNNSKSNINKYIRRYKNFRNPELYNFNYLNKTNKDVLLTLISDFSPDLIICEHLLPSVLINYISTKVPWVSCHHDWLYKLHKMKSNKFEYSSIYKNYLSKKVEYNLVKNANGVICLSEFEKKQIILAGQKKCIVQHVTYPKVNKKEFLDKSINLVHFGGLGATANKLGLEMFIVQVWENIKKDIPDIKLKIIGNTSLALANTKKAIQNDNNVLAYGHCSDLEEVLSPTDIHIIPWEFPTGSRTRVPVALQFGQVLLATQNAVSGFCEMKNGVNCITVKSVKDFSKVILDLYKNPSKIEEISKNGLVTFDEYFNLNQSYTNLKLFLEKII